MAGDIIISYFIIPWILNDLLCLKSKDKGMLKSSSSNGDRDDREESNEPDYDEDEDQLEEKQQEKLQIQQ